MKVQIHYLWPKFYEGKHFENIAHDGLIKRRLGLTLGAHIGDDVGYAEIRYSGDVEKVRIGKYDLSFYASMNMLTGQVTARVRGGGIKPWQMTMDNYVPDSQTQMMANLEEDEWYSMKKTAFQRLKDHVKSFV